MSRPPATPDATWGKRHEVWGRLPPVVMEFGGICERCGKKVLVCEWAAYRATCEDCWVVLSLVGMDGAANRLPRALYWRVLPEQWVMIPSERQ